MRRNLRLFVLIREKVESPVVCRCHYKGSTFFQRPWVLARPRFETATSCSADRLPPNWAKQAAVEKKRLYSLNSKLVSVTFHVIYSHGCDGGRRWMHRRAIVTAKFFSFMHRQPIGHLTVIDGNEARADFVLIWLFLLYYLNHYFFETNEHMNK